MRIVNRLVAIVLSLVLIAVGLLAVVQTVAALFGRPWPIPASWRDRVAVIELGDRRVLAVSIVVGLVGLLLLIPQLFRRPTYRLPLALGSQWWVRRRAIEQRTTTAVALRGGVRHARTAVAGGPDGWRVKVTGEAPADRQSTVEQSIRDELASLGAPADVTVRTSLHPAGRLR
jgi:hypothetical protein